MSNRGFRAHLFAGWLILLGLGPLAAAAPAAAGLVPQPNTTPETMSATLRMAITRSRARDAGVEYRIHADGRGVNPRHGLELAFTSRGALIEDHGGGFALHLERFGRGDGEPVRQAFPHIDGAWVEYVRGMGLREWFVNLPDGVEQGWTVAQRPAGRGPLVLELDTGRSPENVEDGRLTWSGLAYHGLVALDAAGRELPSSWTHEGTSLRIEVDDRAAVYPVVVDPWVQQAKLTASDGSEGEGFGRVVALSGDTALIGASIADIDGNTFQGAAYVFIRSDGVWSEQAKLTASDGAENDFFGGSVALSGDTALIGASGAGDQGQGVVYVFTRSDGVWSEQAKLMASDGVGGDSYGVSVALEGDTALVGASNADVDGTSRQGAAYVFTRSDGVWTEQAKLTAADGAEVDLLGSAVVLEGDTALVGTPFADVGANDDQGAAYIFTRSDGVWSEQAKLSASDGAEGDFFGASVALSGDTALVGVQSADVDGNEDQGAAYVFTRSGEVWSEQAKLTAGDGAPDNEFGISVGLSGDTALVGARAGTGTDVNQGVAYVFTRSDGAWSLQERLTADDGLVGDLFGFSVALIDDTALVGTGNADAAYVFTFSEGGGDPAIEIDPPSFPVTLNEGEATEKLLTITNVGTEPLDYTFEFIDGGSLAARGSTILWEQSRNGNQGIVSGFFEQEGDGTGAYSSDDFVLAADASLETILVEGFLNNIEFDDIPSLTWSIFPDADGLPAGNPETDPDGAIWTFSTEPTGAGVTVQDPGSVELDLLEATGSALELAPGAYWLVFHTSQPTPNNRWNWFQGGPPQAVGIPKIIAPGGLFNNQFPDWTNLTQVNPVFTGLAFTLTGTGEPPVPIECDGEAPPWLSVAPMAGTVDPFGSDEVTVTIDATELAPGSHEAHLCIASNDPDRPLVTVPVDLTVIPEGAFPTAFSVADLDGSNGFKLDGEAPFDNSGGKVSDLGDINSDGMDDFIISAYRHDGPAGPDSGRAYVVFGRAAGDSFPTVFELSDLDGSNGFKINGNTIDGRLGRWVSNVSDVNDDGIDDFIISAPHGEFQNPGSIYVIFGREAGDPFPAELDLAELDGGVGFKIIPEDFGTFSHIVSAVGDVNSDGISDLIIGHRYTVLDEPAHAYVVFGRGAGDAFPAVFDLADLDGNNGFRINTDVDHWSVIGVSSAGDLNGDGIGDMAIASWLGPFNGALLRIHVVFGRAVDEPFPAELELADVNGDNGSTLTDHRPVLNASGVAYLDSIDINNDGIGDLIVSATNSGRAYAVFGRDGEFPAEVALDSDLDGDNGFTISGGVDSGASAAGDINGDGVDDLVVSSWANDNGPAYVVFGRETFAAELNVAALNGDNGFRINGEGHSLESVSGAGDVNGDGLDDLIFGSSNVDTPNGDNSGRSYVVFGRVLAGPNLRINPDPMEFDDVRVNTERTQSVNFRNTGAEAVTVSDLTSPNAPFAAAGGSCGSLPVVIDPGTACTLDYTFSPEATGDFSDTVAVTSDAQTGPDSFDLAGQGVLLPPTFDLAPASFSVILPEGQTTTEFLNLANLGDETLDWHLTEGDDVGSRILWPIQPATMPETNSASGTVDGLERSIRVEGERAVVSHPFPSARDGEVTITHSESLDIHAGNSVACTINDTTPPNQFLRTFTLSDFGITTDFDVAEVTFGVESLDVADTPITVKLYTLEGEFTFANLTLIGSATAELTTQSLTLVTIPVIGTAPAGSTLVVEIDAPSLLTSGVFLPGSNNLGETAPSYLASSLCGIHEPTPYAELDFPDVHLAMTVTGTLLDCTLPGWVGVDPESGSIPGEGEQGVDVTFDASGLEPGGYETNLCLASNDPTQPLVHIPASLAVTAGGVALAFDPSSLDFGEVDVGTTSPPQTATVQNLGNNEATGLSFTPPDSGFEADTSACGDTLPGGESCEVSVTFAPSESGTAEATLGVTSDQGPSATLALAGTGVQDPPQIDVDPDNLSSTLPPDQTETQPLTLSNLGEETLEWQITEEESAGNARGEILWPSGAATTPETGAATTGGATGATSLARTGETQTRTTASHSFPTRLGDEVTLTHSESLDIQTPNTVACAIPEDGTTTENRFLRTFTLTDFDITGALDVTEVTFGIENLDVTTSITVNLYTLEGDFTFDNLTLIGNATQELSAQQLALVTVPVTGTAPAGSTLVVEIHAPDLTGVGTFFPGSNNLGETAPSYIASAACGINEPTPYAEVGDGFPGVHLVMTVTGTAEPLECTLPDWASVAPTSDSVPGGESQEVDVTFDATGVELGEHEANLCFASNDPELPLTVVPLTLTVTDGGAAELTFDPSSLDFGDVEVGDTSPPQSAMLANTGDVDLTGLTFSGLPASGFDADTSACGDTLSVGASCEVVVTFTPTAPGPAAAALSVTSDQDASADLSLTGNGGGEPGFTPMALEVDPVETVSDGNRVFEPGELVDVAPTWRNDGSAPVSLTGTAADFHGPDGADYMLSDADADYGLVDPGAEASCQELGVCYRLGVNDPAARPATHWEATFDETLSDDTPKTWSLHVGDSFTDVPSDNPFYRAIETLLHSGITEGCTASEYCPSGVNSRSQMPVFVLRALEGADYVPLACTEGSTEFPDVPAASPFCPWIEELAVREIISGCGNGNYCPGSEVTRAQMAIFLLKTLEGADYAPPPCSEMFDDVPCPSLFADWIEELAAREITGGCSETGYCPGAPVSRAQMAVFVTRTFGLTLYGP